MGKATKWIINFLMGKREEKGKKTGPSVKLETCILGTPIVLSPMRTPNVRRRWSFKRSISTKPTTHKTTRSFESIPTTTQSLLEYHTQLSNAMPHLINLHVAATKIQAVYRSYLARRALHALRGLVKLQALARGHLVRKQMNTVLRSMHAVMAIQVRARIHRIQITEQSAVMVRRRTSYSEASERHRSKQENIADWNIFPKTGVLRSRSGHIDHPLTKRLCGTRGRPSDSERECQLRMSPYSSTLSFTDTSYTNYDGQVEEFSSKMEPKIFRQHSAYLENKRPFFHQPPEFPDCMPSSSNFTPPNYMNNTKSSKAKSRSHSEPRQRRELGTKQKNRRSSSMDGKDGKTNQYPWLIQLYHSDRSSTNPGECSSHDSDMTGISQHRKSLIQFEPPMNLY